MEKRITMRKLYYIVALAGAVVATDYALRKFNYGKGLFTSTKYMAEYVRQHGLNNPSAQDPIDFYNFFKNLDREYRVAWYKAAVRNTKQSFPSFSYNGGRYSTLGGKKIG
jgi:hypothetical protein